MAELTVSDQTEAVAMVAGKCLDKWPSDLFIPPDALHVLLESFSGPLDLLLYLIKRQNIDILDIPMLKITEQYMRYIQLMEDRRLELAADYLVMAALLAEIKSRMLLPVTSSASEDIEDDPRMALVRRLKAYEQMKEAAKGLDEMPRYERDVFSTHAFASETLNNTKEHPDVSLSSLVQAMNQLMARQIHFDHHQISREQMSVRERMTSLLQQLHGEKLAEFSTFLKQDEGRLGVIVTALAMLELAKQSLVVIIQSDAFSRIYLRGASLGPC